MEALEVPVAGLGLLGRILVGPVCIPHLMSVQGIPRTSCRCRLRMRAVFRRARGTRVARPPWTDAREGSQHGTRGRRGRTDEARNTSRLVGKLWAEATVRRAVSWHVEGGHKLGTNGGGGTLWLTDGADLWELFQIERVTSVATHAGDLPSWMAWLGPGRRGRAGYHWHSPHQDAHGPVPGVVRAAA